ncbi:MAG: hypothetical protein ACTHKL_18615, partial [Streptosporangiaceae bacterium]
MRRHPHRTRWPAAVLAAGGACLALMPTSAAQAIQTAASRAAVPGAASAQRVLLIDGSQLAIHQLPTGGREISLVHRADPTSVMSLKIGSRVQEIPATVLPFLGRGLDPSLVDLGALKRAEPGSRLPVQITFTGHAPKLPGITITHRGAGWELGFLTTSGAAAFGAALARQFSADHARASYGRDGLFAGGVTIALQGAPTVHAVKPRFKLHTLTMAATGMSGKADTGDAIFLLNEDNPARFADPEESFNVFYHGKAKFSVPAGHYWAIGDFIQFSRTNPAERLVVLPQFTVRRDRTVHLSERSASSEISFTTARPAHLQSTGLTL